MTKRYTKLVYEFLHNCAEDDVGLWEIIGLFEDQNIKYEAEIKEESLSFLAPLLERGFISAGNVKVIEQEQRAVFEHWRLSPKETIEHISREWDQLDRLPTLGDIVYFTITEKGLEYLKKEPKINGPN